MTDQRKDPTQVSLDEPVRFIKLFAAASKSGLLGQPPDSWKSPLQ